MIEIPEATTIATQMQKELPGKTIAKFGRGVLTHKFLWLNRSDEDFEATLGGLVVKSASSYGRSIYLNLGSHMLWWGDTGGKLLYHPPGDKLPKKYHLIWHFVDGSILTFAMQMWGSVKLLDSSEFDQIPNAETGVAPLDPKFTFDRFTQMLDTYPEKTAKGIKGFLVATGHVTPDHVSGLGNAIVQDILFTAQLSPKRKIPDLTMNERYKLYVSIQKTVDKAIELGGRYDERDLYNQPGRYIRLMDSKTVGTPCGVCGEKIIKLSYLGGACYICKRCQV
jgi:formamidopyrimidine-DNA glycosylase